MPSSRANAIEAFHSRLLTRFLAGQLDTFAVCGWSSKESQRARFDALLRAAQFRGGSVSDYGCGTGDLVTCLIESGYSFTYDGYDANETMLSIARRRSNSNFAVCALDEVPFERTDYVFASGLFQFVDADEPRYYERIVRDLFRRSRVAVAVNFLSCHRPESTKVPEELYLSPAAIAEVASSLSGHWTIDHSYHPGSGDFTLAVFRDRGMDWKRPSFETAATR